MDTESNRPIELTTEKVEKTDQPSEIIEEVVYETENDNPEETVEEIIKTETENLNEVTEATSEINNEHSSSLKIEEIEDEASLDRKDDIKDNSYSNEKSESEVVEQQDREVHIEEENKELQSKDDDISSKIRPIRPSRKRPVDEHLNIESLKSMTQSMNDELIKLKLMIEEKDRNIKDIRNSFTKL